MSLRFSRRRFSQASGGVDAPVDDPHGAGALPRSSQSNTPDAAVYLTPVCALVPDGADAKCMTSSHNCFPWCMGMHIAGRKNQAIRLYSQHTWEHNVNVAQTDCVIDADESLCAAGAATAVSAAFDEEAHGRCEFDLARCQPSDGVNTWVPRQPHRRTVPGAPAASVRLEQQPFVVAGETYLYFQDGRVTVARLRTEGDSEYRMTRETLAVLRCRACAPAVHAAARPAARARPRPPAARPRP